MNTSSSLCQIKKAQRRERGDKQTQRAHMWEGRWSQLPKCVMAEVEPWSWQHWYDCTQRWTKSWHSLMMKFFASVKCMQRRDDWQHSETPQKGGVSFTETRVWKKADSLWLSRKKGERESSSGSREEREGAKVCSAPVRRGVKEGRTEEWEEREKVCGRLVRSWRKGEEIVKGKGDSDYTQEAEEAYQQWACYRRWARHSRTRRRNSPPGRVVQ